MADDVVGGGSIDDVDDKDDAVCGSGSVGILVETVGVATVAAVIQDTTGSTFASSGVDSAASRYATIDEC